MAKMLEKDADGAEMMVETGAGVVKSIERGQPGARNYYVQLVATHAQLDYPVAGFVDTTQAALVDVVDHHAGRVLEYRLETHRKHNVTKTKFDDYKKGDKVREFVMLRVAELVVGPVDSAPDANTVTDNPQGAIAPLADTMDLAQATAAAAYTAVVAHYGGADKHGERIEKFAGVLLSIVKASPAPPRAAAVLPTVMAVHPPPFDSEISVQREWRATLATAIASVLATAVHLVEAAA